MEMITSRENPTVKGIVRLVKERKARTESGLFVAEGSHLCEEAAKSGVKIRTVLATEEFRDKNPREMTLLLECAECAVGITDGIAAKIADTKAPQGVFCVCEMLDNSARMDTIINSRGRFICLHSLQDPGNVGTVIRTADALGVTAVLLTADCPDLYSPKVLRATMGSAFRIPVPVFRSAEEMLDLLRRRGIKSAAAVLLEDSLSPEQAGFSGGCAVWIGNEGAGLPESVISRCECMVRIPMKGRAESLNAASAAAILAYFLTKPE